MVLLSNLVFPIFITIATLFELTNFLMGREILLFICCMHMLESVQSLGNLVKTLMS